jgi:hypothetical protein
MDAQCAKHQFDRAVNFCRQCGGPFCAACLVYPFGERKPPLCIPCALVASGVRTGRAPRATWRDRRAQKKAALRAPKRVDSPDPDDSGIEDGDVAPAMPDPIRFETEPELTRTASTFEWDAPVTEDSWSASRPATPGWSDESWSSERESPNRQDA